ncbi:MAG: hypothetical protein AMK70_01410 [Nitrospira bacterium SG8_35_1]|nr:MAG: hypothetical protein AMK70_01410 [Nitrospira bacterium SG8_35_1]
MSKIEEALEKANKLRASNVRKKTQSLNIFERVEPREVENDYLVSLNEPNSPVAEEFRKLKSMLLRITKKDFLNTVMITSSISGEGKTITAINLAVTIAQEIDHSILLIDADLRRPMIHNYLGMNPKYGLSDYLLKDIDISEILVKTGIGKMVLLPAGKTVPNPQELLSSVKMEYLIKELKQRYMDRYIIIDTPPILSFAEAISIGHCVDGVIYVVKEGQTQRKAVQNGLHLLKDINVFGVIFNAVRGMNSNGYHKGTDYYAY